MASGTWYMILNWKKLWGKDMGKEVKNRIVELLTSSFSDVYCDTCDGNLNSDKCEDCYRKHMEWGISNEYAEILADDIVDIVEGKIK